MIRFELTESDWNTSKKYWIQLKQRFTRPDDLKKAELINRTLFESSSPNVSGFDASTAVTTHASTPTTPIPSMHTLSEIMSEIDTELKNNVIETVVDINKTQKTTTENTQSKNYKELELKSAETTNNNSTSPDDLAYARFVGEPVEFSFFHTLIYML